MSNTNRQALSKEWLRLAGEYESAANAVRIADYDGSITRDEYAELIDARERAFAALSAVGDIVSDTNPALVSHDLIPHAAHYEGGGHDLARWIVRHPTQPTGTQLAIAGVPVTAEYHCGYVDRDGAQHWVYVERRPMSPGTCDRCGAAKSASLFARRGLS